MQFGGVDEYSYARMDRSNGMVNNSQQSSQVDPVSGLKQLFLRIYQEIEEQNPDNVLYFMIEFLSKHYPQHLGGFAEVVSSHPELERERMEVCYFLRCHQIPLKVASAFCAAGYDTLDSLMLCRPSDLPDIEAASAFRPWLPGHKTRLELLFASISEKIAVFRAVHEQLAKQESAAMAHQFLAGNAGHYQFDGSQHGATQNLLFNEATPTRQQ